MMRLAVLLGVAGCLTVPEDQRKQCTDSSDCAIAIGEICDEGVCLGGPPPGPFGMIAAPPTDRTDLTSVERAIDNLPIDGQLGDVQLDRPVTIRGRVEAYCVGPQICRGDSVAATVTIARAPLFHGGPGFKTVVTSKVGAPPGESSFQETVPPTRDGEPPYELTIVPEGSDNGVLPLATGDVAASEQVPPLRITLVASSDVDLGSVVLGRANSAVLSGNLVDASSRALINYRVVALGRLDTDGPTMEVSTVDYSTTGAFSLTLADGVVGPLAIQAQPYDTAQPTLTLRGLDVSSSSHTLIEPPDIGSKVAMTIAIEGLAADGEVKRVNGARVAASSPYAPPLGGGLQAVVAAEATTGPDGAVRFSLLNGTTFANSYKLRVIPPASSEWGVLYDEPLLLERSTPVRLPRRIALRGRVFDRSGEPMGKIAVTAKPSLRFLWSLDEAARDFAAQIPAASTVTTNDGDFVMWVDPYLAGTWARYDIEFEPQKTINLASWIYSDIEVPRLQQTALSVGDVTVPDSSLLRGRLVDLQRLPVAGGEVAIYRVITDTSLCQFVLFPPADCTIPARRLATAVSTPLAVVTLALPR